MKTYNVIWFDDEYDSLDILKEKATINGIVHKGFVDANSGLAELEKNLLWYDALIVDGLFVEKVTGPIDESAIAIVARTLDRLADRKIIPWFILSGQPSFTREQNKISKIYKDGKVYDKNNDEDLKQLWADLKKEADQQLETQIRHDHSKVFETCTDQYIGTAAAKCLMTILKKENVIRAFDNSEFFFNPLRKIMEDFFWSCIRMGLMPDQFGSPGLSLNEAGKFFAGQVEKGFQITTRDFPEKIVADNIKSILAVCQPASHRSEIDTFVEKTQSPYLLYSITYELLNLLLWFKHFVDGNPNREKNVQLWEKVEEDLNPIVGILEFDGWSYHVGDCFILRDRIKNQFKIGDRIRITLYSNNLNEKSKKYKYFARTFLKQD